MKSADWMRMLEQLREALNQTATEVTRHEQTLASPLLTSDLSGERQVSWQRALERFGERVQEGQGQVQEAERLAERAEAELAEAEGRVASFRSRLAEARGQLAKVPPAV